MAAIAAALPRLHTLHVHTCSNLPVAAVAGFFEDLLPRLRDFGSSGWWPQDPISQVATLSCPPRPLPQLRALKIFRSFRGFGDHPPPWSEFMGARPLELCIDDAMILNWLPPEIDDDAATLCPLACVQTLFISAESRRMLTPTNVARILRASPNVETLIVSAYMNVDIDASWLAPSAHPALGGLVHSNLRRIDWYGQRLSLSTVLQSDLACLRPRPHFPRLQIVNDVIEETAYFVTPLELPSLARRFLDLFVFFMDLLVDLWWTRLSKFGNTYSGVCFYLWCSERLGAADEGHDSS
jgi:hypothetical protein